VAVQVPVVGPLVGVFFASSAVVDYDGARASAATGYYPPTFHGLLDGGVAWAPGAYEILFPSLAHREADIERTVQVAGEAAATIAAGVTSLA
jgi:glutamate-1-semialdehyde 2,1-aminomutase